jgi:hypothetical protein
MNASGVSSRHVHGLLARSVLGDARRVPAPFQLREILGEAPVDENHVKYPKLRRIVKAFQGSEAEMATFVEALTQESL